VPQRGGNASLVSRVCTFTLSTLATACGFVLGKGSQLLPLLNTLGWFSASDALFLLDSSCNKSLQGELKLCLLMIPTHRLPVLILKNKHTASVTLIFNILP
jgi:hypothetical protein